MIVVTSFFVCVGKPLYKGINVSDDARKFVLVNDDIGRDYGKGCPGRMKECFWYCVSRGYV